MKSYNYTYRDAQGGLQQGSLNAASRAQAIGQLQSSGIVPVSLSEGKPAPATTAPPGWLRSPVVSAVAAALLLAAVIVVWQKYKPATPTAAKRTVRVKAQDPRTPTPNTPTTAQSKAATTTAAQTAPVGGASAAQTRTTTKAGKTAQAIDAAVPTEPLEDAAQREPPQRFNTITEQVLAIISSVPPGVTIPPLPELHGLDQDFNRAAKRELQIYADDTTEMAERVESVAWGKVELKELVEQGWKPDEVLKSLVDQHNEDADLRSTIRLALKKIVDDGSATTAEITGDLEEINQALKERNLPEIKPREIGIVLEEE